MKNWVIIISDRLRSSTPLIGLLASRQITLRALLSDLLCLYQLFRNLLEAFFDQSTEGLESPVETELQLIQIATFYFKPIFMCILNKINTNMAVI